MGNNKYKVLIVEDDQSILGFVQTILETNGYQVLTAERCRQGLLIFSSYTPDLVVLDLGLPPAGTGRGSRPPTCSPWTIWSSTMTGGR